MARRRRRRRGKSRRKIKFKFKGKQLFITGLVILIAAFAWTRISFHQFKKNHALHKPRPARAAAAKPERKTSAPIRWPFFSPTGVRSQGHGPRLVFVIDDMGHTTEYLSQLNQLGNRV